jgi:hypothetical protein
MQQSEDLIYYITYCSVDDVSGTSCTLKAIGYQCTNRYDFYIFCVSGHNTELAFKEFTVG